ncbi:MAG TPA: hypothetical protein VFT80_02200 [Actinomycetota bacterium]|nr:hypothetical protein [Actinomycetota bacterium]
MFQKKDGSVPESDTVAPEERAYEDNWYRSLKALAEQRQDEEAGSEEVEASADGPVADASGEPVRPPVDDAEPVASAPDPPTTTADRERLVSQEFETRAGQLLERLRSIQHLGES